MRIVIVLSSLIWFVWDASAQAIFEFRTVAPNPIYAPILGNAWTIFASGAIDGNAAKRLEALIKERAIPDHSFLYFDSPGGSMFGGMALGKVIRAHGFRTYVGRQIAGSDNVESGLCFSACSLAFLGGEYRYVQRGARYGVHQFATGNPSKDDLAVAQMTSATVVEYIRSMEVDTSLFTLASNTPTTEINVLTEEKLIELNVVNNGTKKTKWTMESISEAVYLKGERDTVRGINKALIICTSQKRLVLWFIFDPQGRANEVMSFNAVSIFFDDEQMPIGKFERTLNNGWINAHFPLDDSMLARLKAAHRIGIAYQMAYGAPAFFGFDSMPFDEGVSKLDGLLTLCRK